MNLREILPGRPYPLGANWDGEGVNFTLFSENAQRVELLLFESPKAKQASAHIELKERTAYVWHVYLPGIQAGQLYAYRVYGPYEPEKGQRFSPSKLLIDPYAKAIAGDIQWNNTLFGYRVGDSRKDLSRDERDSAQFVPKSVVIDPRFDWKGDRLLNIPWSETIIYEMHVKGFTMRHPEVEEKKRGTYAGLASPRVIDYLKDLGVTAVELLPVHHHLDEKFLVGRGLSNYWGYNTIGFFAPDARYCSSGMQGQQVSEFKEMVRAFHQVGIEVILDVVYNHTAEGNHLGPTLSFRGIDNASYYRLKPDAYRYYLDFTGTGNTLNMSHPRVLQLIMDSLRYWVLDMHVDGFRFDLAAALARELQEVDRLSAFFDIIQQDPVLSQVKLIAEPWDLALGGYQVGNFPPLWVEWNGKYRDTLRRFWRGDESQVAELAYRLTGSSDLYQDDGRNPYASVNFITCHDGFTLNDLVSYAQKHNEVNEEDNGDGSDENLSWNCGVEGPSSDVQINQLRERQKRNFLASLFLSQGVPMLLGGDEIGRTQRGNNNAYCQNNEISWFNWDLDQKKLSLLQFTRNLIHLRQEHPIFRRRKFFQGRSLFGSDVKDITWFQPDGKTMTDQAWSQSYIRTIGALLSGEAIGEVDKRGKLIKDDTFLLLLNADHKSVPFIIPGQSKQWEMLLSTDNSISSDSQSPVESGIKFGLEGRSVVLFRQWR